MKLQPDDYLYVDSYRQFCDYQSQLYEDIPNVPPSGIVYCPNDQIKFLFQHIENQNLPGPYVIVSSESDFGLCYQSDFPVNADMPKALARIDFDDFTSIKDSYKSLRFEPPCVIENCRPMDIYSLKCYHYTHATFNHIPQQIKHWFSANLALKDPRCSCIPLGMLREHNPSVFSESMRTKKKLLYINFSNITIERKWLKETWLEQYGDESDWFTLKDSVSHDEYIEDLKNHMFIMCPRGNGYDSYKIYQSLYCHSIPIVTKSTWSSSFINLPILFVDTMRIVDKQLLLNTLEQLRNMEFSVESIVPKFLEQQIKDKWKEVTSE